MSGYQNDDICIVGYGCVLPDAPDADAYWNNLLNAKCSIRPLPENRWSSQLYCVTNRSDPSSIDRPYTNIAAFIEDALLLKVASQFHLDPKEHTRLELMTLESVRQATASFSPDFLKRSRASITLGCMQQDEAISLEAFLRIEDSLFKLLEDEPTDIRKEGQKILSDLFKDLRQKEKPPESVTLTTSVIHSLGMRFGIRGEGALIDAACASSLASIDVGMRKLKSLDVDMAITGGIESNLCPETFVIFCAANILSKEPCLPLDSKANGICQGEGAAVFVLERLEDALKHHHPIHGIIRSCSGSSNGKGASIFSPSVDGQQLALKRAYRASDPKKLCYIECHATGTPVGDSAEMEALETFLPPTAEKIPIGSVKALIGHTRGTAGAASLLKCVLALKEHTLPPSPHVVHLLGTPEPKKIFANRAPISIQDKAGPLLFGVSSAGFGGTNYHLLFEEFRPQQSFVKNPTKLHFEKIVVVSHSWVSKNEIRKYFGEYDFRIPPKHVECIDELQLQALMATREALDKLGVPEESLPRDRISVISASILGIEKARDLARRVRHYEIGAYQDRLPPPLLKKFWLHKDRMTPVSDDTGPGSLNNVIAGRVSMVFDFHGSNFNVDADLNSSVAAMSIAEGMLRDGNCEIVVLLCSEDQYDEQKVDTLRGGLHCFFVTTENRAQSYSLTPRYYVEELQFEAA